MSFENQILELLSDGEPRGTQEIASALLVPEFMVRPKLDKIVTTGKGVSYAGKRRGTNIDTWRRRAGGRQPELDAKVDKIESTKLSGHQQDDESDLVPPMDPKNELWGEFPPDALINEPHWILDALGWEYREPAEPADKASPPMDSPIRWMGGKSKMVHQLIDWYPDHYTYVEVFGGSLKPFFCKQPSHIEVVNDVYTDLINFWRVASRWPRELAHACNSIPASRVTHRLFQRQDGNRSPWERAVMFGFLVRSSFNGKPWSSYGGSPASGPGGVQAELLERCAARLSSKGVFIECQSFGDLIKRYNKKVAQGKVFFYLDPPYYETAGYADSFPAEYHRDLAHLMDEINDNGNLVLITNSPQSEKAYRQWLKTDGTWYFDKYTVKYSAGGSADSRGDVSETIISNFKLTVSDQARQGGLF